MRLRKVCEPIFPKTAKSSKGTKFPIMDYHRKVGDVNSIETHEQNSHEQNSHLTPCEGRPIIPIIYN
jgi:hypothetical protein